MDVWSLAVAPEPAGGAFAWREAVSSEIITFAFGVLLAFVIPWLTVLATKKLERKASERAERLDAAMDLLRGASAYLMEGKEKREPGSYTFWPVEMNLARARVLILTKSGRRRGEAALTDVLRMAGREMVSSELGVLLGNWVPKGRFPVTNPLHHKAARWLARRLQPSARRPAPENAVTPE